MHLKSKKGVDIYHEFYLNLDIKNISAPEFAKVPVGTAAETSKWNKTVGDKVKKFDIIAYLKNDIPIYSTFSGTLTEIVSSPKIGEYTGMQYAVIKTENDNIPSYPLWDDEEVLNKNSLLKILKNGAVVDEVRKQYLFYTLSNDFDFGALVIDAFDDQPYNLSKTAAVLNYKDEVYLGAEIIAKAFNIKDIKLLINENFKTKAILKTMDNIEKITVGGKYPTKPVIQNYCAEKSALRIGAQCCRAVFRAVYFREADLSRIITVWGDSIAEPSVARVPFGVPAENILKEFMAFGMIERVVSGGVMTGHVVSLNFPIYKWESSLTVMPLKKHHRTVECINCGRCAHVCPLGLAPYYLLRNSNFRGIQTAKELCAGVCDYCGACAYICPARIPLVDIIKNYKEKGN